MAAADDIEGWIENMLGRWHGIIPKSWTSIGPEKLGQKNWARKIGPEKLGLVIRPLHL
jgi:hypothetical protein